MKTYSNLTTIGGLFLAASLALAQSAPTPPAPPTPAPQAMPAPPAPPTPVATPWPSPAPMAAQMAQDALDRVTPAFNLAPEVSSQISAEIQMQMDKAQMDFDVSFQKDFVDAQEKAAEKMAEVSAKMKDKFNFDFSKAPFAMQSARTIFPGARGSDDAMYQNGLRAIDNHQYEQALSEFNNVAAHGGARAEGALYWKAYVLNKLGRSADAQAAIDTLRKTPTSRWLDDAKALELEVKQSKGPVSPDSETDEEIKVLALNGLMQSDPEKALPQVEKLLQGTHSPNLKRRALYVIAQSNLPKAQQDLEQTARGGNPDLQVSAIQYLAQKRNPNSAQILLEIYTASSDPTVKRTILDTFSASRDKDRLLQILKSDKDATMRTQAIRKLGDVDGQPELWQIYQSETTPEGKIAVLDVMRTNGNLEKLADVARTDKDAKVRQKAVEIISTQQAGTPSATLTALYSSEQDEKVKQTIIDHLNSRNNCKPLVDVAKAEKDMKLKLRIVDRLSNMTKTCPAATEYLTELLSK